MQSEIKLPGELTSPMLAVHEDNATRSPEYSAFPNDTIPGGSPTDRDHHSRRRDKCDAGASETGSHPISIKPDAWWRSIPSAMSWLVRLLIEGFAACGEAMHPGFFEHPGDRLDSQERVGSQRWGVATDHPSPFETSTRHGRRRRSAVEAETSDILRPGESTCPVAPRTASLSPGALVNSSCGRFWSKSRREGRTSLMISGLEDLDERSLRDIGICHHGIERPQTWADGTQ
jgi:hypothetical protein